MSPSVVSSSSLFTGNCCLRIGGEEGLSAAAVLRGGVEGDGVCVGDFGFVCFLPPIVPRPFGFPVGAALGRIAGDG